MNRFGPIWFSISAIAAAWLAMTAVHELGHIMHAWFRGGRVVEVELPPRGLGHTRVDPNPHPQFVAWGGACWGCSLPLAIWLCARRWAKRWLRLATFFAGMCLIANGVYLAIGGFMGDPNGADDAHELLRHGAAQWETLGFGALATSAGLWLWHELGRCALVLPGYDQSSRDGPWFIFAPEAPGRHRRSGDKQSMGRRVPFPKALPNDVHVQPLSLLASHTQREACVGRAYNRGFCAGAWRRRDARCYNSDVL